MRFAVNMPNFGAFSDARALAELAREAEEAGWDGFFLWDHINSPEPMPFADPWVTLTAIAMRTQRIRLGALVTPLPRRRPWKVAREAVTLDHLCGGRLVLGVGIGSDKWREYSAFGEPGDDSMHGAMLDEALTVIAGLWSGEPFSFSGQHYNVSDVTFLPKPLQESRIPIWVAGFWPNKPPFRRAARWDGICPINRDFSTPTPQQVRDLLAYIRRFRDRDTPFDVTLVGGMGMRDPAAASALLHEYADAGVTWWEEGALPDMGLDDMREIIRRGPPRM